jgi:hypothetical protein
LDLVVSICLMILVVTDGDCYLSPILLWYFYSKSSEIFFLFFAFIGINPPYPTNDFLFPMFIFWPEQFEERDMNK